MVARAKMHELLANDLVNASVLICWETHITALDSSGDTDISGGIAGDICSGEQKIRGDTYLRYTATDISNSNYSRSSLIRILVYTNPTNSVVNIITCL